MNQLMDSRPAAKWLLKPPAADELEKLVRPTPLRSASRVTSFVGNSSGQRASANFLAALRARNGYELFKQTFTSQHKARQEVFCRKMVEFFRRLVFWAGCWLPGKKTLNLSWEDQRRLGQPPIHLLLRIYIKHLEYIRHYLNRRSCRSKCRCFLLLFAKA